jgi:hypothetical protein
VLGWRPAVFEPHQVRGSCQEEAILVQPVFHALPLIIPPMVHLNEQLLCLDVRELKTVKSENVVYFFWGDLLAFKYFQVMHRLLDALADGVFSRPDAVESGIQADLLLVPLNVD